MRGIRLAAALCALIVATPWPSPWPSVETERIVETVGIPFETRTVDDPDLDKGTRVTRTEGVEGVKTLVYDVTTIDGRPVIERLVSESVTRAPVDRVVAVGTRSSGPSGSTSSGCDPNYSGCVPIASDVDCAGGRGNGPEYVRGPVNVVGEDIYGLDADGDGVGCER